MNEPRVRTATPDDEAAVAHVLRDSYSRLWTATYEPELLAGILPIVTRPNGRLLASGRYYLAELHGRPVGCGGWSMEMPGSDRIAAGVAHIRHFAVSADYPRRGLGRLIFDACAAAAREEEIRRLHVFSSLSAEAFYAALGFRRVRAIEVPMTGGLLLPTIHMRLRL